MPMPETAEWSGWDWFAVSCGAAFIILAIAALVHGGS